MADAPGVGDRSLGSVAYVTIPKTGTTAIGGLLLRQRAQSVCLPSRHTPMREYERHEHQHTAFVTYTRDPVDIYCSLYYFVHRPEGALLQGTVLDQLPLIKQNVTIAQESADVNVFLDNCVPNAFQSDMWGDREPEEFDFIGDSARPHESAEALSGFLGIEYTPRPLRNVNPMAIGRTYRVPKSVRARFEGRCAGDVELHLRAQARATQLIDKYRSQ